MSASTSPGHILWGHIKSGNSSMWDLSDTGRCHKPQYLYFLTSALFSPDTMSAIYVTWFFCLSCYLGQSRNHTKHKGFKEARKFNFTWWMFYRLLTDLCYSLCSALVAQRWFRSSCCPWDLSQQWNHPIKWQIEHIFLSCCSSKNSLDVWKGYFFTLFLLGGWASFCVAQTDLKLICFLFWW